LVRRARHWPAVTSFLGYHLDRTELPTVSRKRLPRDFRVGEWLVQPSLDRLSGESRVVHLRPKLMDVLVYLAEHVGEVLPKDDIIAAVWAQQFLAESVLTRSITELRQALGDDPEAPRYIETVTKRGYRLIAAVEDVAPPPPGRAQGGGVAVVSYAGKRIQLADGESVIGRGPDAVVRIDAMPVSRHHARILFREGRALLEDLHSKNGTLLDETPVQGAVELADGATIRIGPAQLVFHLVGALGSTETSPAATASGSKGPSKDAGQGQLTSDEKYRP
jgi:DNA-binding winged helix-turn-helix (wHTH) protein